MPPILTEGFVLKKINFRETSVILTLFTKEFGKIKGILKGVRKEKSKIPPLTFSEGAYISTFIYKRKSELNLLSSPSLINFFYFEDKLSFTIFLYILKLIDLFTPELQKEENIFYLIEHTVESLKQNKKKYIVFLFFKIKFIEFLGYGIKVDSCSLCGKESKKYFFSPKKGGLLCEKCRKEDLNCVKISNKLISIIRFIKRVYLKNFEFLKISKKDAEKINYLCNLVFYYHSNLDFIWWRNEKNIFR
ncbi:MAG: DNA repair protein RecO [Candidatus Omnitrophica bacterium]|nr:DNA repair protein RecO [Candidatus Omnitrophota bacterium]MCM8801702.1 DNA repair protein RecO [Candidatus Omnitrophota bacterium]